jgi:glyoxylase-like metal-dependent hydrolase (beta-lactamase superfamily II)
MPDERPAGRIEESAMPLPIAEHWFETRRLSDDVTLIWEPHVSDKIRCNIFHVRGRDRDMLIDSGMGLVSLREHVAEVTEKRVCCVATHTHFDHVGGHHEFPERLVHRAEADILRAPDPDNTVITSYVSEAIFTAYPYSGFDPGAYRITPAPASGLLGDGDVVDLGDRSFEVMHLPGHSPGSIALWEEKTRTLFSGDVIYDGTLYDGLYHSNVADYIASLERLQHLPVETIHGGHHGSFGRARLLALIDGYLASKT